MKRRTTRFRWRTTSQVGDIRVRKGTVGSGYRRRSKWRGGGQQVRRRTSE